MPEKLIKIIKNSLTNSCDIITSKSLLKTYLVGTEGFDFFKEKERKVMLAVKVRSEKDIKLLLDVANSVAHDKNLRFSIYPISTGNNWGYGTSQPASTDKNIIILDLGELTEISFFDEELGLVTIEPGVTQQQLSDYLTDLNQNYMVPVTGAGPECSILSNALERGYGITPYTDHFGAVTSVHGYWANGLPYESAINELDESKELLVDKTFKWGVGPYLDGLFTQSNFGIVSKITIRLAKIKPAFTSFFIQINDDSLLEDIVPLVRRVLQEYEGIVGSINLMDQRRILSMFSKNPNGNEQHKVMSSSDIATLSKNKAPAWTVVGSIYGTKAVVKAVKKEINNIFKQLPSKRVFSNSPTIKIVNKIISWIPQDFVNRTNTLSTIASQLDSFNKGKEIMLGKPNKVALKLAYWRHSDFESINKEKLSPGKDGCGLLWYAPLVSMKADKVREFVEFVRETCPKFNIEPFITFTNLRHDCIDSTIPIVFDLSNQKAVEDAHNCLKSLVLNGLKKGFVPYRLNIDQQQWLLDKDTGFWKTVNTLKQSIDGNNILSPGRYNPR